MEAPYAVSVGSSMLVFVIFEAALILFMDIDWAIRRLNKKQKKKGKKQKRKVRKQKKNRKVSVEQEIAGTSERGGYSGAADCRQDGTRGRGEHSGAAEGKDWQKEQKQTDDALLLEEIVELD